MLCFCCLLFFVVVVVYCFCSFLLDCVRFLCDNYPLIGKCEAQCPLEDVVAYGQGIPPGGSLAWLPCWGRGITKQRSKVSIPCWAVLSRIQCLKWPRAWPVALPLAGGWPLHSTNLFPSSISHGVTEAWQFGLSVKLESMKINFLTKPVLRHGTTSQTVSVHTPVMCYGNRINLT